MDVLKNIGIINKDGKLNLTKATINEFFERPGSRASISIMVESGTLTMRVISNSFVTAVEEKFATKLPDGNYTLNVNEDKTVTIKELPSDVPKTSMKLPSLNYTSNALQMSLERDDMKEFL